MSAYDSISTEALLSLDSMEGVYSLPVVEKRAAAPVKAPTRDSVWPGYYLTALTAAIAYGVHYLPFAPFRVASESGVRRPISSAIVAILAGVLIRNLFPVPGSIVEGCKVIVRKAVPLTIVLTGAGLNLALLATVGARALTILVKLVRVTLLAPFMIVLMLFHARQRRKSGESQAAITVHYSRFVPPFVWGFLALALLNTASLIPTLQFHVAPWVTGHAHDF